MSHPSLQSDPVETLPLLQRLALSYAPRAARLPTLALLALDTRLAGVVRSTNESLLAQLKLAWWRDRLTGDPGEWPAGEPLLAILRNWPGDRASLVELVNGWEALTGEPPLPAKAIEDLAGARGMAFAALAAGLGRTHERNAAERLGRGWGLVDVLSGLSDPAERETARALARQHDWREERVSRKLRPLAVLHGLAARSLRRDESLTQLSPSAFLHAVRLGIVGR